MKKSLPTLYARGKKGQVLIWNIEIDGNKYRTITGAESAKKVISEWTVCEGKNTGRANFTTPEQQAMAEATSKWTAKRDKEHYFEEMENIDVSNFVECMLAQKFADRVKKGKVKYPVMVDKKFNGMRQITVKSGPITRKGKPIVTAPHIVKALEPLFKKYPNLVLDGELYNHDYRYKLNELMPFIKKTVHFTADTLAQSEKVVQYYVYDGYGFDDITEETPCHERREALKKLLRGIKYIVVVSYKIANTEEEVYSIFNEYVDDGYEGAIVRVWDGSYEHTRSYNLLKVKPENDEEGFILDIKEGTGNWSDAAYQVVLKMKNGSVFEGVFKGPYEDRVEILKNKKDWIGKEVTYTFMGYTGKGIPNSARIDPKNCFKGD